jgi:hypothetical protein
MGGVGVMFLFVIAIVAFGVIALLIKGGGRA